MPGVVSNLVKLGDWSPSTNTPTLPNVPTLGEGQHYECVGSVGTFLNITFNKGDFIFAAGGSYQKLDNNTPEAMYVTKLHAEAKEALASGLASLDMNESPIGLIDGSNATYASSSPFLVSSLEVYVNGILQRRVIDYNTTGNSTILFTDSPQIGDTITISYTQQ
jgi:hypothetical protein